VDDLSSKNRAHPQPFPQFVITPVGASSNTGNVRATSLGPRTGPHRTIPILSQREGGQQRPADLYSKGQEQASCTSHRQLRCTCPALSGCSSDVLWLFHVSTAVPAT